MKLYSALAEWWPLLSAPAEYADEAESYWRVMSAHAKRSIHTLLELGCGGGNNAMHLKRRCQLTLTDISPQMLAVSRKTNPECAHILGDMRSLRLGRRFDAVFVHDAVMYLRTEDDLRQAMTTAFEHCAEGGVALFAPDCTRETWTPGTDHGGHDDDGRGLRYLEWTWDPDPGDSEYVVEMVYVLRESGVAVRVEHERHRLGLFGRSTWLRLLEETGFRATSEHNEAKEQAGGEVFVGVASR